MTIRVGWAAAAVLLMQLTGPVTMHAQDTSDGQVWVQALALGQLGDDWRTHVEVQPRVMSGASELGLTIVRTAIGRRVAPRVTAWVGHAWVPRTLGEGVRHEQRLWQQLLVNAPVARGWTPTVRLRVEQRWLQPWDGASHRVRLLARGQRPLGAATPWAVFAYDEAMFTLDQTRRGPARGFDRNRLAAGLVRRFSPAVSSDLGYIWETATIPGGRRNDHVLLAVLNLSIPR